MRPYDIIEVKMSNGISLWWEVEGIFIGGLNQEGVVRLRPINQSPNSTGNTLVPHQLLDVAFETTPAIKLYREVQSCKDHTEA